MRYQEHELLAALLLLIGMDSNANSEPSDTTLTRYRDEGYITEDGTPQRHIHLTAKGRYAALCVLEELHGNSDKAVLQ